MDEEIGSKVSTLNLTDTAMESPNEEAHQKFNQLIKKAKKYVGECKITEALECNQKALKINYSEKLARKIKKMEDYLAAHGDDSDEDDDGGMIHVGKGFYMYRELYNNLYSHQQHGVLWFWSLNRRKKGGILGDDMGLGKTIQVIAFLSGMFDMQKIHSVLIVLPVAVMMNWAKEIQKWAPGLKVTAYHGNGKRDRNRALYRVQKRGGICLTTYGMVVTSFDQIGRLEGKRFEWDYIILDEGHKIKNPTKTNESVHNIPAQNRIILTGTPVQNNLKELWALFDFVHQGTLLGTQRTFKMEFDNPITRAREKDSTLGEKKLGMEMAQTLKTIIAPYFLRRTKAEVKLQERAAKNNPSTSINSLCNHAIMPTMTRKNDLIVWTYLNETQLKIYVDFLSLETVKELLMSSQSPLVALNVLKKICDHPRLLSTRACAELGLNEDMLTSQEASDGKGIQHIADNVLIQESGKLVFLVQLLDRLKTEGHRSLVFSQSRKMLDIMQKVIGNRGHKIMRLDGTISSVHEREQRIQKFQTDSSYSVFLLTTQVGGVGLTLTAADRVVIFDPNWNPATDAQAVDRVFRIGQDKDVVIYRLITCGSVEEKIYRRQIFKDSITRQTTGDSKNPYRYFSKFELKELFTLDDPRSSTTQQQLEIKHGGQRRTDQSLDQHIAYLYSLEMYGLSDHDLMFTMCGEQQDLDGSGSEPPEMHEASYIYSRVQKAREIIQMESTQSTTLDQRFGKPQPQVPDAAQLPRTSFKNWEMRKPKEGMYDKYLGGDIFAGGTAMSIDLTQDTPKRGGKDEMNSIDLTSPAITDIKKEAGMKHEPMDDITNFKHEPMDDHTPTKAKQERNIFANNAEDAMEIGTPKMLHPNKFSSVNKGKGTPLLGGLLRPVSSEMTEDGNNVFNMSSVSLMQPSDFKPELHSTLRVAMDSPSNSIKQRLRQSIQTIADDSPPVSVCKKRNRRKVIDSDDDDVVADSPQDSKGPWASYRNIITSRTELEEVDGASVTESVVIIDESLISIEDVVVDQDDINVKGLEGILERSLIHTAEEIKHMPEVSTPSSKRLHHLSANDSALADGFTDDEYDDDDENGGGEKTDEVIEDEVIEEHENITDIDDNDGLLDATGVQSAIMEDSEIYVEDTDEPEEEGDDFDRLPEEKQLQYNYLIEEGRAYCHQKDYESGLGVVLRALNIYADPELQTAAMNIQKKVMRRRMRAQTSQHQ